LDFTYAVFIDVYAQIAAVMITVNGAMQTLDGRYQPVTRQQSEYCRLHHRGSVPKCVRHN